MSRQSTIPRKDVDFNVVQGKIINTATTRMTDWDLDAVWMNNELLPKKANWDMAWTAYIDPTTRTPTITANKVEKRKMLEKPLRLLVKNLQSNTHVSNEDLREMGIVIPSPTPTPSPVASKAPDVDIDTSVVGRVSIDFFEREGHHKRGKPPGQHCVEIRWMLSDTPPTRWDELTHSEVDTRSPYTLSFEYDQRGKTVYFALRWENTRGEKGPWSEIISAIIP